MWNSQDWDTFNKRTQKMSLCTGRASQSQLETHQAEAEQFFKTFPDNRVGKGPYLVLFSEGD